MYDISILLIFISMTNKKSCSLERQVGAYLRPRVFMMFIAEAKIKIRSKSSLADDIISAHYESLSLKEQEELITEYKRIKG